MTPEDLRAVLQRTNLSQYQADAYVTLVELGEASAVETANACDVPQARIYDVLRDLEGKGYVETYERDSLHARANEPTQVVDELQAQADSAIAAAEALESRWERQSVADHRVSVVDRFQTVVEHAAAYVGEADTQLLLASTVDQFESLAPDLADAADRDVVVKVALQAEAADEAPDVDSVADHFPDATHEVRTRSLPGPFVLVADRDGVCFAPDVVFHPANEYGMVINDGSLGQVFKWFFETSLWEAWDTVYSGKPDSPPIPYTSIRDCIRDVAPLVDAGRTVHVRACGRERPSGDEVRVSGRVTAVVHSGRRIDGQDERRDDADESTLTLFAQQATITLETADGPVDVGGWGAVLEDVEADQLVVESVD